MGTFIGDSNTRDFGNLVATPLDTATPAAVARPTAAEQAAHRKCPPRPRPGDGPVTSLAALHGAAIKSDAATALPLEHRSGGSDGTTGTGYNLFGSNPPALACFEDELSALAYFESIVWPHGRVCPRCRVQGRVGRLDGQSTKVGTFKCYACRRNFSITRGTLFDSTHVPLHKWMQAIYLTAGGAQSIRASQLARIIDVSFKTAARMLTRLEGAAAPPEMDPDASAKAVDRGGTSSAGRVGS
jgi:transposase-like protein